MIQISTKKVLIPDDKFVTLSFLGFNFETLHHLSFSRSRIGTLIVKFSEKRMLQYNIIFSLPSVVYLLVTLLNSTKPALVVILTMFSDSQ